MLAKKKKNNGKIIGLAGNHSTSQDTAEALLREGYDISCIINMADDLGGSIAGYFNLGPFATRCGIPIIRPRIYSLSHKVDRLAIKRHRLDVLIVFGWQRLIPSWLLADLSVGAFGTHGSPEPLPKGRGRSVLNWGIIRGKKRYINNLFKYDAGVDSGKIVASQTFAINVWDSIDTLHHKDQLIQQLLLLDHLPSILSGQFAYKSQPKDVNPTYFPKRTPEDGSIDWHWKSADIYNLVRAVSRPYPGAYTYHKKKKIMIWRCIPFEPFKQFKTEQPGAVVSVFADGTFLVKTGDGTIQVTDFEPKRDRPSIGTVLKSMHNRSFDKLREAGIR